MSEAKIIFIDDKPHLADGEEVTVTRAATILGRSTGTVFGRIKRGFSVEESLTAPIKNRSRVSLRGMPPETKKRAKSLCQAWRPTSASNHHELSN